jgi:hypothetical protein
VPLTTRVGIGDRRKNAARLQLRGKQPGEPLAQALSPRPSLPRLHGDPFGSREIAFEYRAARAAKAGSNTFAHAPFAARRAGTAPHADSPRFPHLSDDVIAQIDVRQRTDRSACLT